MGHSFNMKSTVQNTSREVIRWWYFKMQVPLYRFKHNTHNDHGNPDTLMLL